MKTEEYTPNHIPKSTRIFNFVWGTGLVALAVFAWTGGSFHLPGKGASEGVTYTGNALTLFIFAAAIGAINLFITIVDHYDKRNNEQYYKKASQYCSCIAVFLVIAATAVQFANEQVAPVVISNGN
ncbi:hypothetical protein [Planctobacterium marinum]|uniref:hypothetical protein n=1 Tax=Planctobacterium marinum TaxID=1631968 RepID=UPI001E41A58E|nr:hypothetical protein [Planctobacterium marinum]MCC2605969.1 hypothetical protein [Planctobacterium marinum]